MSKSDNIIRQYLSGDEAESMCELAAMVGGVVRVEGDSFIMADGTPVGIQQKSMLERWAEEEKIRPANWLQVS